MNQKMLHSYNNLRLKTYSKKDQNTPINIQNSVYYYTTKSCSNKLFNNIINMVQSQSPKDSP